MTNLDDEFEHFFKEFELTDPEPPLDMIADCDYEHRTVKGVLVSGKGFKCYPAHQVRAHIEWLTRMGVAYKKWLAE